MLHNEAEFFTRFQQLLSIISLIIAMKRLRLWEIVKIISLRTLHGSALIETSIEPNIAKGLFRVVECSDPKKEVIKMSFDGSRN
jgi:hypothetical protein